MNRIITYDNFLFIYNGATNKLRIEVLFNDYKYSFILVKETTPQYDINNIYKELNNIKIDFTDIEVRDVNNLQPIIEFLAEEPISTIKIDKNDFGVAEKAKSDAEKIMMNRKCDCMNCNCKKECKK